MATIKNEDEFMTASDFEKKISGNKTKTTEELMVESIQSTTDIQTKVNKLRDKLTKEEKTKIRISPSYQPYLGKNCQISINGIPIVVPVNGTMVEIPQSYAAELYRRMAGIDALIDQQSAMAQNNQEQSIGSIRF